MCTRVCSNFQIFHLDWPIASGWAIKRSVATAPSIEHLRLLLGTRVVTQSNGANIWPQQPAGVHPKLPRPERPLQQVTTGEFCGRSEKRVVSRTVMHYANTRKGPRKDFFCVSSNEVIIPRN